MQQQQYKVTLIVEVYADDEDKAADLACDLLDGFPVAVFDVEKIDADHGYTEADEDARIEALAEAHDNDLLAQYDSADLDLPF